MALSRFVLTANVTTVPDTVATPVAGEPGTGGAAGFGNSATVSPATIGKYGLFPQTFLAGTVIMLDSALTNGLYAAIGAGNLRAYVPGQDDRGGAALSN
jgi:hypothetical protein